MVEVNLFSQAPSPDRLDPFSEGRGYAGDSGTLFNASFQVPPPDDTTNIDNVTNPLPGWTFVQSSGTAITAALVVDATVSSGYKCVFTMAAGSAGDESYLEQIVSIPGSQSRTWAGELGFRADGPGTATHYVAGQFLLVDGTATGSNHEATSTSAAAAMYRILLGSIPADAASIRIRFGWRRNPAAVGATGTLTVWDVRLPFGTGTVYVPDITDPTKVAASLEMSNGDLILAGQPAGLLVYSDGSNGGLYVVGNDPVAGLLGLGAATVTLYGGQIAFPSTAIPSASANTLDDYEEGTWTPVISFDTPGNLNVVYSVQVGVYTKIGQRVLFNCNITTTTFTHTTAAGNFLITGLPFTVVNTSGAGSLGAVMMSGWTKATYTMLTFNPTINTTQGTIQAGGSGVAIAALTITECATAVQKVVRISGHYTATA